MSNLLNLLTNLSLDPKQHSEFVNSSNSYLDRFSLSKAEKSAFLSGESAEIVALLGSELTPIAAACFDPGPDPLPDPDPFPPSDPEG